MSFETAALILSWGAIVLLAFAMAGLLRQVSALHSVVIGERPLARGPEAGQPLPQELASLTNGESLLVFMDRDCPGCEAIAPELGRLRKSGHVDLTLVYRGEASPGNGATADHMGLAFERLGIPATPFGVRADADGQIVAAAPIGSAEALMRLVSNGSEVKL